MKVTTSSKDKVLFTPGPLTTSFTVKQAMLTDLGSRDISFIEIVRQIRQKLLAIGSCSSDVYTAVPTAGQWYFWNRGCCFFNNPIRWKIVSDCQWRIWRTDC